MVNDSPGGWNVWLMILLAAVLLLAAAAPLTPLASNRFHHDEALYSSWGLDIASGRDIMVSGSPVDKPPLSLYVQAVGFLLFGVSEVSARIPSLLSHVISVWLLFRLGRLLGGDVTGLLAALLLAASPFAILFAATAFTDSMMVVWVLAGCLLALRRRWLAAGILMGMAAITKQQGIFFLPLALGLAWVCPAGLTPQGKLGVTKHQLALLGLGLLPMLTLAGVWDLARGRQPGFLMQSLLSYGGLAVAASTVGERLASFLSLLRFATGSTVLNWVLLVGGSCLVVGDVVVLAAAVNVSDSRSGRRLRAVRAPVLAIWGEKRERAAAADLTVIVFCALFLAAHAIVSFRVWDRYLLGLIPWMAFLLARVLTCVWRLLLEVMGPLTARFKPAATVISGGAAILLLGLLAGPVRDAAASRLPVGGDHGAYEGIDQVIAFLKTAPADTTLYHHWLRGHWRFYLWSNPYDFRYWGTGTDLARQAAKHPGAARFIVFPSWQSATEAGLALEARGMVLEEVHRALRSDGSVSFRVFRIEETE